jgi:hypothetical protein
VAVIILIAATEMLTLHLLKQTNSFDHRQRPKTRGCHIACVAASFFNQESIGRLERTKISRYKMWPHVDNLIPTPPPPP